MIVHAWNNGKPNTITGAGYGIRISHVDYGVVADWERLTIGNNTLYRSDKPFTRKCPEIRSKVIGEFLISRGLHIWEHGKPHSLELIIIGDNSFELAE